MTDHAETTIQRILNSESFRRAAEVLAVEHDRTIEDIIRLTETEAPSFQESVRAQTWFEMAKADRGDLPRGATAGCRRSA